MFVCQQVGQSASSNSVPGPSGQKPVHLTKSVLLARISTELKTLGEEYARKEHLRMQKTASCSQLDSVEGMSIQPPKENIGPGQCSSRSRHAGGGGGGGEGTSMQTKASHSGILQQHAKTLSVANLPSTSKKKLKSSTSRGGPLRPVTKSKALRRSKTQELSIKNSSSSGDSIPFGFDAVENAEVDTKVPQSMELCATPKRLKVSGKGASGKLNRKQAAWSVKSTEVEEKSESHSDSAQLPWSTTRSPQPQVFCKKATLGGKLEKTSRLEVTKVRPSVLTKVKAVKKLCQSESSNLGASSQGKFDQSQTFGKLTDRPSGTKGSKSANIEALRPNLGATMSKEWIRSKSSTRNLLLKAGKVDISVPGPSTTDHSGCEAHQFPYAGTSAKVEQKFNVLRSLEKGAKSRLLCPVRRRSCDGKKSRKNVDRRSSCSENNSNLTSGGTQRNNEALNDGSIVN